MFVLFCVMRSELKTVRRLFLTACGHCRRHIIKFGRQQEDTGIILHGVRFTATYCPGGVRPAKGVCYNPSKTCSKVAEALFNELACSKHLMSQGCLALSTKNALPLSRRPRPP